MIYDIMQTTIGETALGEWEVEVFENGCSVKIAQVFPELAQVSDINEFFTEKFVNMEMGESQIQYASLLLELSRIRNNVRQEKIASA